jgi:hypothetical protein
MFGWIQAHLDQIVALGIAAIIVGLVNKGVPKIKQSGKERGKKFARWATFVLMVIAGLSLAYGAVPFMRWLIGGAGLGGVIAGIGGVIALALGWHGIAYVTSIVRDLADKVPDEEGRQGALWGPTLLISGGAAVLDLVRSPNSIGSGFTAAAMAAVTLAYVFMIQKRALSAQNHKPQWAWFVFAVMILGGLVLIPLVAYLDGTISGLLPGDYVTAIRVLAGVFGAALIGGGVWDIVCDGVPNRYARAGAIAGIPLATAYAAIGIAVLTSNASNGAEMLKGVF